jgi:hypothetical protein
MSRCETHEDEMGSEEDGGDCASASYRDDEHSDDGEGRHVSAKHKFITFDEIQRERRLALNRASARDRRKRKKDMLDTLGHQVMDLKKKLEVSDNENKKLRARVAELHSALKQTELTVATLSCHKSNVAQSTLSSARGGASVLEEQALQHLLHRAPIAMSTTGAGLLANHPASEAERTPLFDNFQRLLGHQQTFPPPSLSRPTGIGTAGALAEPNEAILRAMLLMKSRDANPPGMQLLSGVGAASALASRPPAAGMATGSDRAVGTSPLGAYSTYLRQQALQPTVGALTSWGREHLDNAVLKLLSGIAEHGESAPARDF